MNIRISGLGGQGAVTAAHLLAMAANKDGKFSISNPFFGAEKRMAPAESYARIGTERIYDRGELVYPDVIMIFHPQVITMQKKLHSSILFRYQRKRIGHYKHER
jgi:pyruvate ferredoxin oxidoreductase gamma subunit